MSKVRKYDDAQFSARMLSDVIAVLFSWFASYFIRFFLLSGYLGNNPYFFYIMAIPVLISSLLVFVHNRLYSTEVDESVKSELINIVKSVAEEFFICTAFYYFVFPEKVSRLHLVLFSLILLFFVSLGRSFVNRHMNNMVLKGEYCERILLVGHGEKLQKFYDSTKKNSLRFVVCGQLCAQNEAIEGVAQIETNEISKIVEENQVGTIIVSFPTEERKTQKKILSDCLELSRQRVFSILQLPESYIGSTITDFRGTPIIQLNSKGFSVGKRLIKRAMDIAMSLFGIIVLSPIMLVIAFLVKLTSKGPVFFVQKRVTRDGRVFNMYKFRSMRTDMKEGVAHWTEIDDPRVTKVGRFIRKTSIDELPQLFNVLGGSMSMIGPRPERPELEEQFRTEIPGYNTRHRMKAGITGWAQVNGLRGQTSLVKRIDYDLYYIRNWSISLDIKIVFLTFFQGFINKNAY